MGAFQPNGYIICGDGIDFLTLMSPYEDANGRSMVRMICQAHPKLVEKLLRVGKLKREEIRKDGTFVRIYPREKVQQLGVPLGIPRFLLTVNFDGTDAHLESIVGKSKDEYIATLEEQLKFFKGKAALAMEQAQKQGVDIAQQQKEEIAQRLKPMKDLFKTPFWPQYGGSRFRPRSMGQPVVPTEEESGEWEGG